MASTLPHLAKLLQERNRVDSEIARLIGRPAARGHIGEFIDSEIFGIELEESAARKAIDGRFRQGPLAGRTVNIKWFAHREGILDIATEEQPDVYLVFTGAKGKSASSRGGHQPLVIESAYLFDAGRLLSELPQGRKTGTATSVPERFWRAAEIYPEAANEALVLTAEQRAMLGLFAGEAGGCCSC